MKYCTRFPRFLFVATALLFFVLSAGLLSADDPPTDDPAVDEPAETPPTDAPGESTQDPIAEEETATLEIVNAGDHELLMLFVSPSDSDFFGPEVLGHDNTLPAGDSHTVRVHADAECFDYDVFAVDVDGFPVYSIRAVCEGSHEEIRLGEKGILEEPVAFEHFIRVDITNTREEAITSLFAAATDSRYRGADLLDNGGRLEPGDTKRFSLADTEAVEYNVFARLDDGNTLATQLNLHEFRRQQIDRISVEIHDALPAE